MSSRHYFIPVLLFVLLLHSTAMAQDVTVSVRDDEKKPLTGATVRLSDINDSSNVFFASTDIHGNAELHNIADGMYLLSVSFIGFGTIEKTVAVNAQHRSFSYVMEVSDVSLNTVTISADRPFIRQEDDKTIVDPTPMIGISTNTLEVIEATPGVYVDYDAGIFLSGTAPAMIFINGREQKLSNQDIMNLLRNLPPGSIEKIEILRTPSTKYDAASSGGIVNVVLKKGLKIGRFGNINIGMNQGRQGNRNAGFSFNNSGDKTTGYLNVNYSRHDHLNELNSVRLINSNAGLNQQSETRQWSDECFLGYGISYDPDSLRNFSYDGRLRYGSQNSQATSSSFFSDSLGQHLTESIDHIAQPGQSFSVSQDFSYQLKLDTAGSVWDNKFSIDLSKRLSDYEYNSEYSYPIDTLIRGGGADDQLRMFLQGQSDLTLIFKNKITLESGVKGTWQQFMSDADYFTFQNTVHVTDSSRIHSFRYNEGIAAAYAQASKTLWKGFVAKAGCRLEYTYMNGEQTLPSDTFFTVNRADLFPYLYLSHDLPTLLPNIIPIHLRAWLIYRRTISRPDYEELNPARAYIDAFLYEAGNPALKPMFTHNVEFNISFEDMPVFAAGINYTNDIFSGVVYPDPDQSGVAIMTTDNLGSNKEMYLRGMIGIPPGGKYFFAIGSQYNYNEYDGFYAGTPLNYERGSWRFFTFHSLNLFKQTRLTLNGFMMLNGSRDFIELDDFGSLNCGISQTLLNRKLIITLNARDILRTMGTHFEMTQGPVPSSGWMYRDSQRFGINIRYNFGLSKKENRNGLKDLENNMDL